MKDLDQAIGLNPSLRQAYESRGLLALMEGDSQIAIQDFTKAIWLGSDAGLVHYNRGIAFSLAGKAVKAQKDFQLACERKIFQACGQYLKPTPVKQFL